MKLFWFIFLITLVLIESQDYLYDDVVDMDDDYDEVVEYQLIIGYRRKIKEPGIIKYVLEMNDISETCKNLTNVDEGLIKTYNDLIWVNNSTLNCYMYCVLDLSGGTDVFGQINFEYYLASFPDQKHRKYVKKMLDHCTSALGGTSNCEKAYSLNECMLAVDPVHFVLP